MSGSYLVIIGHSFKSLFYYFTKLSIDYVALEKQSLYFADWTGRQINSARLTVDQ